MKYNKSIFFTPLKKKRSQNSTIGRLKDDESLTIKRKDLKRVASKQEKMTLKKAIAITYFNIARFIKKELNEVELLYEEFQQLYIFEHILYK